MPQTDVPLALLTFNLGVEAGQVLYVVVVLLVISAVNVLITIPAIPVRMAASYLIGTMSMPWLVTRLQSFRS